MGAVGTTSLMTAEEFVALPEAERERPWNLVNGEVVVNSARLIHGQIADNVLFALKTWIGAETGRGSAVSPIDVAVDERNVYAPDVSWYSAGRVPTRDASAPYPMPDLAVEVRSPSTWRYDVGAKRDGYERHGLPELWLVDTDARSVIVYRRTRAGSAVFDVALEVGEGEELTSPLLPGFALAVDQLFAVD